MTLPDWIAEIFRSLPPLETDRLTLRQLAMSDAEDVYTYSKNPNVARFVSWPVHQSIDDSYAFLNLMADRAKSGQTVPWGVVEKSSGIMIGTCGVNTIDPVTMTGELGYALSEPVWGKGYATESSLAVRDFAFATLKLERLKAVCNQENLASAHVLEKIGMTYTGPDERFSAKDDTTFVLRSFAIDRDAWSRVVLRT